MVIKVNGGIINNQTLTGSLRYFKMVGPFAWTVSDGTVNLPDKVVGGDPSITTYFQVGEDRPVPLSAAEWALQEITKKTDIAVMSVQPASYGGTTEIHFACSASAFGWGSDTPPYDVPPANMPEDLTAAAPQMEAAVQALGIQTVYITAGSNDQANTPVTAVANLGTVTITEVPFKLA